MATRDKLMAVQELLQKHAGIIHEENNLLVATGDVSILKAEATHLAIPISALGDKLEFHFKEYLGVALLLYSRLDNLLDPLRARGAYVVLSQTGEWFIHEGTGSFEFSTNASGEFQKKCVGYHQYYRLYFFISSASFADHHNAAAQQIVLYSSSKGIFRITYGPLKELRLPEDIEERVNSLIDLASKIELTSFVKNAIITVAGNHVSISLQQLILQTNEIIEIAHRDYELVSRQFDFAKFRDALYVEKEKYFNSIREIINKIFSQAVGIPISISATVFATYKVSDDFFMLAIAGMAFLLYVIFYVRIQWVYLQDLKEVQASVRADFAIISSSSGLPPAVVESEKVKIKRKLTSSLSMTRWMIGVMIGLGTLVCVYIIYQIALTNVSRVVCALIRWFG